MGLYYLWDVPWCMSGNFNITLFSSEQLGKPQTSLAREEFLEFIFELYLMNLLVRGEFTWSNS